MSRIHLAVIGNGRWAKNYPQAALCAGNARVVQVVPSRGDGSRVHWGMVDAVVYAGHPADAVPWVRLACDMGKSILVEKPAGLSLEDALAIAEAERNASDGFVLVGHQHLFARAYMTLRELALGRTQRISARFTGPVSRDYPALIDYGAHAAACLIGIVGAPMTPVFGHDHLDVSFRGTLPGTTALCVGMARVTAERAAIVEAEVDGVVLRYDGYQQPNEEPPLTREVRAFADAVLSGGTDDWRFGAHWAVDVMTALRR